MKRVNPGVIKRLYFWGFSLLLCIEALSAQEYIVNQYELGVADGLIHREVNALHQDSTGYIWMGTPFGLNRYDGYEFDWWTPLEDNLNVKNIYQIEEDRQGYLWLFPLWNRQQGYTAIDLFDPNRETVTAFSDYFATAIDFSLQELAKNALTLPSGKILIGFHERGRYLIADTQTGLTLQELPEAQFFIPLTTTDRQTVWALIGPRTFAEVDLRRGNIIRTLDAPGTVRINLDHIANQANQIVFRSVDPANSSDSFHTLATRSGTLQTIDPKQYPFIRQKRFDQAPVYYELPYQHWQLYDFRFLYDQDDRLLFDLSDYLTKEAYYRSLLIDRRGRIWFGSDFGVTILDIHPRRFRNFFQQAQLGNQRLNAIRGIEQIGEHLFVNLEYEACFRYDLTTESIAKRIEIDWPEEKPVLQYRDLARDSQGRIWIGESDFLHIYDPAQERIVEQLAIPSAHWSIYFPDRTQALIGTSRGLWIHNLRSGDSRPFTRLNRFAAFGAGSIYHMEQDRSGQLWAATETGLYRLDLVKGVQAKYANDGLKTGYLPASDFQHFHIDSAGIFWLATRGNGLLRFDPRTQDYQQYSTRNGLPDNVLYAVYEDEFGFLWLPSNYGIIRFEKATGHSWSFTTMDGITNNEFNRIAHHQAPDGRLFFGTIDGVNSFHPRDFQRKYQGRNSDQTNDNYASSLVIKEYQRYDSDQRTWQELTAQLVGDSTIVLRPQNEFFTLQFALLDLFDTDQIRYFYTIEGLNEEWLELDDQQLRLGQLPYGDYRLRVTAQSSDGQRAKREVRLNLLVIAPFYRQAWFLPLCILLLLSLLVVTYQISTRWQRRRSARLERLIEERTLQITNDKRIIEQQAEQLKELDRIKTRFFANISHEFRTPLTLIIEPLRQLLQASPDTEVQKQLKIPLRNSRRLLNLVNQLLNLAKLEDGSLEIHLRQVDIVSHLKKTCQDFLPVAEQKGIELHCQILSPPPLSYWDTDHMERILFNLLSNAIKYTETGGRVSLSLRYEPANQIVYLNCQDTGIGIPAEQIERIFERFYQADNARSQAQPGTGIGLSLVNELTKLLGGTIEVESVPGQGSEFRLSFPLRLEPGSSTSSEAITRSTSITPTTAPLTSVPKPTLPAESPPATATHSYRILIVEDNPDLRYYIRECLPPNYEPLEAADGAEGIALARQHLPDLIISDIMMPQVDGYELTRQLKTDILTSHIPIILLTAKAALQNKLAGLQIGADAYLTKPFHHEELLVRIENLIQIRQRLREKFRTESFSITRSEEPELPAPDRKLLEQIEALFLEHLDDDQYTIDMLAGDVYMSRSQLHRKFKALTGTTPKKYFRTFRLKTALRLAQEEKTTVMELAERVGFKDERYFAAKFKKQFGILPSDIEPVSDKRT